MKKLKIFAIILLILTFKTNAQFYGQKLFDHSTMPPAVPPALIASSAFTTSSYSSGFLNGMFCDININGRAFFVRKTDLDGNVSSVDDFFRNFKVYKDNNCSTLNTNVSDCAGVTVIETTTGAPTNGSRYALVAALSGSQSGSFLAFATLDQTGNLVNNAYYDFPSNTVHIKKPSIIESSTPGSYYICGAYHTSTGKEMYVLKVNTSGTIIWSRRYIAGLALEPNAIIESPFNNNELVIVGRIDIDTSQAPFLSRSDDGFFLKLSTSNGNIQLFNVYGEDFIAHEHQWFNSIAPAFSTHGGSSGFVIGGYSDELSNSPGIQGTWVLKVDPNGGIIWNTLINNQSGMIGYGEGTGVFERFNANIYTYFCATSLNNGLRAYKLDNTGALFSTGNNLFEYNAASPINSWGINYPVQLTQINNSPPDDGFQLFGTDGSNNQDNYFVKAYFDGNSGCSEILTTAVKGPGPSSKINPPITAGTGLNQGNCASFSIVSSPWILPQNLICGATSISGASNLKANTTEIQNNSVNKNFFELFPNPSTDEFTIKSNKTTILNIVNELGQLVKKIELNDKNKFETKVEGLDAGIYFISSTNSSESIHFKIVVNK